MPAAKLKRPKLTLAFHETSAAKKSFAIKPALKKNLKLAAESVTQGEHPSLSQLELQVIFFDDEELLALNTRALGHDWYTDIITFEIDRSPTELSSEIYLSVDRARENAKRYHNTIEEELARLVIHGLLHLAGYDDHTLKGKKQMRTRERFYLVKSGVGAALKADAVHNKGKAR